MATNNSKKIGEATFKLERDTKNTFRFQELNEAGDVADASEWLVGTLYLQKSLFNGSTPDKVKVTLENV
jgi:hypothetical protein